MPPRTAQSRSLQEAVQALSEWLASLHGGLLAKYAADRQTVLCADTDDCFFGSHPTLAEVGAYGNNAQVIWTVLQLFDLSEYAGAANKLTGEALKECARLIAMNYGQLKLTELMLFFFRFKSGRYSRFYGSVDPLVIKQALADFWRERKDAYFLHEVELEKRRREQELAAHRPVTFAVYLASGKHRNPFARKEAS